jgi:hypothetical protein
VGYPRAHNYVLNNFLVNLNSGLIRVINANDLVYMWVYGFFLVLVQPNCIGNSPSRRPVDDDSELPVVTPPRQRTPVPTSPLVPPDDPFHETWNVSPSDVASAADDWRMGSPGMSLSSNVVYSLTSCPRNFKLFFA